MSENDSNLTQLEQRLNLLVGMPTVTGDMTACQQAIDAVSEECRTLGMHVHKYGGPHPSMVATTRKTRSPKIMLVAHLDVVPPSHDGHFTLKASTKKLSGRGVYDMKHAAACFLEFLHVYAEKLDQYDLGVMLTTDEEIGGYDGVAKLLQDEGWRADVAYIPDSSSGMRLEARAKGVLQVELTAKGRDAHSSRLWEGDNALSRMTDFLTWLQKGYPNKNKTEATLSVNYLHAGDATNQIPDKALARIDIRSFSDTELSAINSTIKTEAKKRGISHKTLLAGDPLVLDKDNEYVKKFWSSFDDIVGREHAYIDAYGATDGRWFAEYGIPCIIIAPDGGDFHGPDEWVSRSDLKIFYDMTVDYINRVHGFDHNHPTPQPAKPNLLRKVL
jgi:succinyl-diaminopimelate desuccinylase